MSPSPPKETDVEQADPSPDNSEHMDRGDPEAAQRDLAYEFEVKEQDRWLPIANVARIMKTALPENAKIAKEAKECMQECVSEFISFITSEASEKCQQEKRKTVNGEDILFAMTSLGFENYAEALKIYLTKYRETQSARGENQNPNRPSSSYGQGGGQSQGGAQVVGLPSAVIGGVVPGSLPNATGPSAAYQGPEDPSSSLLGAQLDTSEQVSNPYGNVYPPGTSHNGTGAEHY